MIYALCDKAIEIFVQLDLKVNERLFRIIGLKKAI